MTLTEETLRFIREHRKDNVRNLALQAHKYPTVDVPAAIIQIVGRQIAEEKIPAWAAREGILYPAHLSMEQCSSEVTANYKVKIVSDTGYGRPAAKPLPTSPAVLASTVPSYLPASNSPPMWSGRKHSVQ